MEEQATHHKSSSVPVWVWVLVGLVIVIALASHSKSTEVQPTLLNTGSSDTNAQLEAVRLQSQTTLGMRILDIAGALDIANIQAKAQHDYGEQQIRAIQASTPTTPAPQPTASPAVPSTPNPNPVYPNPATPSPVSTCRNVKDFLDGKCIPTDTPIIPFAPSSVTSRGVNTSSLQFASASALATKNVRDARWGIIEDVAGAIGQGVQYARTNVL